MKRKGLSCLVALFLGGVAISLAALGLSLVANGVTALLSFGL